MPFLNLVISLLRCLFKVYGTLHFQVPRRVISVLPNSETCLQPDREICRKSFVLLVMKNASRPQGSVTLMRDICYGMNEFLTCHGIQHSDLEGYTEEASTSETRGWLLRRESLLPTLGRGLSKGSWASGAPAHQIVLLSRTTTSRWRQSKGDEGRTKVKGFSLLNFGCKLFVLGVHRN